MRDDEITGLYYDLKAPYEVLVQLDEGDTNAIGIGRYLEKALDMLDLRDPYSAAFYASVAAARRYMKEEFYGASASGSRSRWTVSATPTSTWPGSGRWPRRGKRPFAALPPSTT